MLWTILGFSGDNIPSSDFRTLDLTNPKVWLEIPKNKINFVATLCMSAYKHI